MTEQTEVKKVLKLAHYPNIGSGVEPFYIDVFDEKDAIRIYNIIANQHLYLYKNKFIPDYANVIELLMLEDGELVNYYNDNGEEFSDLLQNN